MSNRDRPDEIEVSEASSDDSSDKSRSTRLYFWGGIVSAIISVVLIPIVGLIAVYCGYKVRQMKSKFQGTMIAGVGGIGVLAWVAFLIM